MGRLLRNGEWQTDVSKRFDEYLLAKSHGAEQKGVLWVCSMAQWQSASSALNVDEICRGLAVDADIDLEAIAGHLSEFDVILIDFPHFSDGRGFSVATQLRERYGYRGELRASGYLLVDQLYYLQRCGFDSFSFRNTVDPVHAVNALSDFSASYQSSAQV